MNKIIDRFKIGIIFFYMVVALLYSAGQLYVPDLRAALIIVLNPFIIIGMCLLVSFILLIFENIMDRIYQFFRYY